MRASGVNITFSIVCLQIFNNYLTPTKFNLHISNGFKAEQNLPDFTKNLNTPYLGTKNLRTVIIFLGRMNP